MKTPSSFVTLALAFASHFLLAEPQAQMATPDPLSPLRTKKVMVLEGGSISGDHLSARTATYANLQSFASQIGFTLSKGDPLNLTEANLAAVDIIIFNYFFETELPTVMSENSKTAFQRWLEKGGKGYVGYHTSGANEWAKNEWPWYQDHVTSMRYALHGTGTPLGQVARTTDDSLLRHGIMKGLPAAISANDEWYAYDATSKVLDPASGCKVMYYLTNAQTLDRKPFDPHPVAWFREDAAGSRYFFATFIHSADGANSAWFKSILLRALEYVSGDPAVPILQSHGASALTHTGRAAITSSRELTVHFPEAFTLSVYAPNGTRVFSAQGQGETRFAPPAFGRPGLYTVKVKSHQRAVTQRFLVF
jgi:Trehalose utilisation